MRTLDPYPIPGEEGRRGSLIIGSATVHLNRYFCGFFIGMPLFEWKSEIDFLLREVLGRLIGSQKEHNLKGTTPSGSSIICSISFICLDLS